MHLNHRWTRNRVRRWTAGAAVAGCAVALVLAVPQTAHGSPKPPPNPTNGQLSAAAAQKQQLADQVGRLSGQLAAAATELQQLEGRQELAEQKVALEIGRLQQAQRQAIRARTRVTEAANAATDAHTRFVQYLQASFTGGDVGGTGGDLLTAPDPSALLAQSSLDSYQAEHDLTAVSQLQRATVAKSNADSAARRAVLRQRAAKRRADSAKQAADSAVAAQQQQRAAIAAQQQQTETQLAAKQLQLATLNHERATFLAYQAEQRRLAAERRARERAQRLAQERAEAAARRAAEHHHRHGGGGGSSGNGGYTGGNSPAAPTGGSWTAAKGRRAVARARSELGVMYAWAGGNQYGPTYGVCDPSNGAPNDCYVKGFDCSGLAMYAWGEGWDHYAASQYSQAGSYHPSLGNLKPGDLLFYSYGGRWQIHHVAIYIGHGDIIQAPNSGEVIEISSMYAPGTPYGATRPLT